ncbi:MAG: putative PAS domain S-box protein [Promethearchaeota archaeon]|nr:MAG: putative PAS domain S-box protein [Candidatus Lokiarchaeota archaeon]
MNTDIHKKDYGDKFITILKKSYTKLLENIDVGYYEVDLKGNFLYCNEKLKKILGYEDKELIGENFSTFLADTSVDQIFELFKNSYALKQEKQNIKIQIKTRQNKNLLVDFSLYLSNGFNEIINGFFGIIKDRTWYWNTKEKLKVFKEMIDTSQDHMYFKDIKGRYLLLNSKTAQFFGHPYKEVIGKKEEDLLPNQKDAQIIMNDDREVFEYKITKKNLYKLTLHDGKEYWLKAVKKPFFDAENNIRGLIGLRKDINALKPTTTTFRETIEKRIQEEVKERTSELEKILTTQERYKEELIKASRFKSEFLATMSHELRTPLNPIIGFTELLLEEGIGHLNDEQKEYLTDIKLSAEHQHEMINKVLDITKIESGNLTLDRQNFSLNNIIDQIKSTIKPMYVEKGLNFRIKGLKDNMEIYADPIRFKEILLNLLTNAIKYTIEGLISLSIKEKYNNWVFKVRDTGIGIARKDFKLIFEEFKRVDSTYVKSTPGTGLGLSLTKRLIELHHGKIEFTSVLGMGTTFIVSLPKKEEHVDLDF